MDNMNSIYVTAGNGQLLRPVITCVSIIHHFLSAGLFSMLWQMVSHLSGGAGDMSDSQARSLKGRNL